MTEQVRLAARPALGDGVPIQLRHQKPTEEKQMTWTETTKWLEPIGEDLRFVLAIAKQEPFSGPVSARRCDWCHADDRGQDMPHERGCIWVEAAAKRTDWIEEVRRQTGAGKMDAGRALDRYADVGRAVAFIEGKGTHRAQVL